MEGNIIVETFIAHPEEFVRWIFAILGVVASIVTATVLAYKTIEKYRLRRNELDERTALIHSNTENIEELKDRYDCIIEKMDKISSALDYHIENSRLDNQAMFRNDLITLYRHIKSYKNQYILDQDLQNYISMFDRYTRDNGNGYVHDVIDPFIRSLPIFLTDEQADEYFKAEGKKLGTKQ